MSASAFDTLATVRDLEAAGVERRQAEAHAEALRQAIGADRGELATKADVAGLRAAAKADIADLRAATKADVADLKADMLKVAIGVAIGVVIANATLTAVLVFGALRLLQP